MMSTVAEASYRRNALAVLFVLTALRFWMAGRLELIGDEAYYWMWSRQPDLAYFSKPPGIAWIIQAGTFLIGDTSQGVRLLNTFFSFLSGWGLFVLGRNTLSARVGFWAMVSLQLSPLFWAGGLLMTIDAPLICAWIWAANALWALHRQPSLRAWAALAMGLAGGMLVKWTMAGFLATMAWWWLSAPEHRKSITMKGLLGVLLLFALSLAPVLYWNHHHDYITFEHLKERGALDRPWQFSTAEFAEYLGGQFAAVGPWFFAAFVLAAARPGLRRAVPDQARAFYTALFAPLLIFYTVFGLNDAGQPNWTAAAWLGALLFTVAAWLPWFDATPGRRRGATRLMVGLVAITVAFHAVALLVPFEREKELFERQRGHRDLARQAQAVVSERNMDFVIGQHYQTASLMAFYWPQPAAFFTPPNRSPRNQYDLWPSYRASFPAGSDALYIARSHGVIPDVIKRDFSRIEEIGPFRGIFRGVPERTYWLYHVYDLRPEGDPLSP